MLSAEELERYDRQLGPGVLTEAQQLKLKQATVLVTRVGGMGGPAAQMLTMAGVGHVIIAHGGPLIEPDLNRQVLGDEAGLGSLRAPRFADYLRSLNRWTKVEALAHELALTDPHRRAKINAVFLRADGQIVAAGDPRGPAVAGTSEPLARVAGGGG